MGVELKYMPNAYNYNLEEGPPLEALGIIFDDFWYHSWSIWAPLGRHLAPFCMTFGTQWHHLGQHFEALGPYGWPGGARKGQRGAQKAKLGSFRTPFF